MTKTSPLIRFFLSSDADGHSYVVPVEHCAAWQRWCDAGSDTSPPRWATRIDSPESISFTDWAESDGDINA